jgi:hypothetical protein
MMSAKDTWQREAVLALIVGATTFLIAAAVTRSLDMLWPGGALAVAGLVVGVLLIRVIKLRGRRQTDRR